MAHVVHKGHEEKMELSGRYWTFSQHSTAAFRVNEPPEDTGGQTMRPSVVPSSGSGETHGRVQKIPSIPALLLLGSVDEDGQRSVGHI